MVIFVLVLRNCQLTRKEIQVDADECFEGQLKRSILWPFGVTKKFRIDAFSKGPAEQNRPVVTLGSGHILLRCLELRHVSW